MIEYQCYNSGMNHKVIKEKIAVNGHIIARYYNIYNGDVIFSLNACGDVDPTNGVSESTHTVICGDSEHVTIVEDKKNWGQSINVSGTLLEGPQGLYIKAHDVTLARK